MKKLVTVLALSLLTTFAMAAEEKKEPETRTVCVEVMKDGKPVKDKNGKTKMNCKKVKAHKKHEGTAVPTK